MDPIYLDYAATTPVRNEVRAAMEPYLTELFGNPSSLHRWGRAAGAALEEARARAAAAIGARPAEVRFVRGGTESDNMAIFGTANALCNGDRPPRLLVSAIEHAAVLEAADHASDLEVARVTRIPVSPEGELDWEVVDEALADGVCIVSAMWVNNETGMLLPIAELTERAKAAGAIVHTDASQAVGKVPVDVSEVPVDLLTATGHKIYGPKGTGILFVRSGTPLSPLLYGGGQERGLRPGTEDVAGAVGLATALELAVAAREKEAARLESLRTAFEERLTTELTGVRINAGGAPRAGHVSSVAFSGLTDGAILLMSLDMEGVAVSAGSACSTGAGKGSHVVAALYGPSDGRASVRFSFGSGTSEADVLRAATTTIEVVNRLRAL